MDIMLDGMTVDEGYYTLEEGSTIITLTEEYLSSLNEGVHTIRIDFTDGYAQTDLTIKGSGNPEEPGDPQGPSGSENPSDPEKPSDVKEPSDTVKPSDDSKKDTGLTGKNSGNDNGAPKTGDQTAAPVAAGAMILSLAAIAVVLVMKCKKK